MRVNFNRILCIAVAVLLYGCGANVAGVNPTQVSNLDNTTKIEVIDLYSEGEGQVVEVSEPADVQAVIQALNSKLTVTPKTFCAPQYNLVFFLNDGTIVEIQYFCDGIAPFIRSNLDYFQNQDYAVPGEFVDLINTMLTVESVIVDDVSVEDGYKPGSELANPASVFCEEHGGAVDIREDETGGQYGVCIFENNSECEEWAFFRGECEPGE